MVPCSYSNFLQPASRTSPLPVVHMPKVVYVESNHNTANLGSAGFPAQKNCTQCTESESKWGLIWVLLCHGAPWQINLALLLRPPSFSSSSPTNKNRYSMCWYGSYGIYEAYYLFALKKSKWHL